MNILTRRGKRREMTRVTEVLETIRARIATLPSEAELRRRLRKLRKKTPKLNLRVDELRQELQRLNELASLTVAAGMNEVAYFCRDVPKAPDPDPELIRFGGLGGSEGSADSERRELGIPCRKAKAI